MATRAARKTLSRSRIPKIAPRKVRKAKQLSSFEKEAARIFAARMRALRESRGLTQEQMAKRVGCWPKHISYIETGRDSASVKMLTRILAAMQCTWVEFWGGGYPGQEIVLPLHAVTLD